jgi:hypothetical protein
MGKQYRQTLCIFKMLQGLQKIVGRKPRDQKHEKGVVSKRVKKLWENKMPLKLKVFLLFGVPRQASDRCDSENGVGKVIEAVGFMGYKRNFDRI